MDSSTPFVTPHTHHVFISYVREDSRTVDSLAERLKAFGISVWLDREQIAPGRRWKDVIREAIADGAFYIACFSQNYAARSRTYMNEEMTLAIDELRQRPQNTTWFIPVSLDGTLAPNRSIGGGETLHSLQHVDLRADWEWGVQQILLVIRPEAMQPVEIRTSKASVIVPALVRAGQLVALDFGTSVSCIATSSPEYTPILARSPEGEALVPSVVTFDRKGDYVVGTRAIELASDSRNTPVFNIKRLLGSGNTLELAGRSYSPELAASLVIRSLVSNAVDSFGTSVKEGIVSVPANFSIAQCNSLARACSMAGLRVVRLVGEPAAAALLLHQFVAGEPMPQSKTILALDLGGGTFDVAVLDLADGVFEIKSIVGANDLGGADFDDALFAYVRDAIRTAHGSHFDSSSSYLRRLYLEAVRAKIALTSRHETSLIVPNVEQTNSKLQDIVFDIDRAAFRKATAKLTIYAEKCIRSALREAALAPKDIDLVILCGQGTKIFNMMELVEKLFIRTPLITEFQEAAVIRGLCRYSAVLSGQMRDLLLLDANYTSIYTLCNSLDSAKDADFVLSTSEEHNNVAKALLPGGTTLPTFHSFRCLVHGEGTATLLVMERGVIENAAEVLIGRIALPRVTDGEIVELSVDCDANRTIVIWVANPQNKTVIGYQLNNDFQEFKSIDPTRRFGGIASQDYRVMPVRHLSS